MGLGGEPDTDDAAMVAEQWQKDFGASGDATIVAAALIWMTYCVQRSIAEAGRDIAVSMPDMIGSNGASSSGAHLG
jgi:hypothetical protein